jgi:hypothetical protein
MLKNQWLKDRLKVLQRTGGDLAVHMGWARRNTVTDLFKGERKVKTYELTKLAEFLQMPEKDVMRLLDVETGAETTKSIALQMAEIVASLPVQDQLDALELVRVIANRAERKPKDS